MLISVLLLAQGNPGDALVTLVSLAGIGIVPAAIGSWVLWASKGRPKSSVVVAGLVVASAAFLIWVAAFISYCTMPSPDEEIAVEMVESAYPILDTGNWSYSAEHPSQYVWIIIVKGHAQAGQPIDKKFRVSTDEVEEEQSSAPSGWVVLKHWPMPFPPASQSTSAP